MALCGFDKQMLEGLKSFHRGLAETVLKKIKQENVTREINE